MRKRRDGRVKTQNFSAAHHQQPGRHDLSSHRLRHDILQDMAKYEEPPVRTIPFVSFVHPDTRKDFREIAADTKTIRENRSNVTQACVQCTKMNEKDVELQRCARVC